MSGHEGTYIDLFASYLFVLGRGVFAGVGPGLRLGNERCLSAIYGITDQESTASGLTAFDVDSGLESIAMQGILSFPVSDTWNFTGVLRLGRLMNNAGDSSLTARTNQLFFVAAMTRRF